jgi:ParB-like chromosome segregation protein Spo0J
MSENILITKISPSRWQPRSLEVDADELLELARSIKNLGLFNPVIVFPEEGGEFYELVAGERRTRASLAIAWANVDDGATLREAVETLAVYGLGALPGNVEAIINDTIEARVEDASDMQRLHRIAVMENIERSGLTPIEEAHGLHSLAQDYGWSQRRLAEEIGKSQGYVAQRLALLDLSKETQGAISRQELTLSHARELQGVQDDLQETLTREIVRRVKAGATTRDIKRVVDRVTTFFDTSRYSRDMTADYTPEQLNRLRVLRWASQDVSDKRVLAIAQCEYARTRVSRLVEGAYEYREIMVALFDSTRRGKGAHRAWLAFAADRKKTCVGCLWDGHKRDWSSYASPPCAKWDSDQKLHTCHRYTDQDGLVLSLPFSIVKHLDELGISYNEEPEDHVRSVERWLECYDKTQALEQEDQDDTGDNEGLEKLFLVANWIEEYQAFQESLPEAAIEHFQSHICKQCTNYEPGYEPACRMIEEPPRFSDGRIRPPQMGVLVTRDGLFLPRCGYFSYALLPQIHSTPGCEISDWAAWAARARFLVSHSNCYWSNACCRHILQWMDYDGTEESLERALRDNQYTWSGSEGSVWPTLLDTLMQEIWAEVDKSLCELIDPTTGEKERFAVVPEWEQVMGRKDWYSWKNWPEGFDKLWE